MVTRLVEYSYFKILIISSDILIGVVVEDLSFTTLLTSQVISVAFYSEIKKSDKFCSEALISAWGSFTCRKSTTRVPRLYFTSEGSHTQDFYALKKIHRQRPGLNPWISDPEASMITTGTPGSAIFLFEFRKHTLASYQFKCLNKLVEELSWCIWNCYSTAIASVWM